MIRQATNIDIPVIRQLMQTVEGFWQGHWSDDTLAKGINSANGLAFVWEEDSEVLGFICAHDFGFRAYLSELIVAERARGWGIGRQLVERVQSELSQRGCAILIADVWREAVPFYRSLGWEPPDAVLLRRRLETLST